MSTIKCCFLKNIYADSSEKDSGYRVHLYRFLSGDDSNGLLKRGKVFSGVGKWLPDYTGATFTLEGNWEEGKYGLQFHVTQFTLHEVSNERGVKAYLRRLGFDDRQASAIWKRYDKKSLEKLDEGLTPFLALGLTEKRVTECLENHKKKIGEKDAIVLLGELNIKQKDAIEISDYYKEKTAKIIKEHPYRLIHFNAITFAKCERLATMNNAPKDTIERTCAGVMQALRDAESNGNTGIPSQTIITKTKQVIGNDEKINDAIALLCNQKYIVLNKNLFQRKKISDTEWHIAKRIMSLSMAASDVIGNVEEKIQAWEKQTGITLAKQQKEAVITSLTNGFSIITGGPGRGKTTIAKCIVDIRKTYGSKDKQTICMMAPTGQAAKKLHESTQEETRTTHSRLQIRDSESFTEAEEKITDATVLLDESSMLDIWVANAVVSNIEDGCQVSFIGDIDQLPSVGAGAVLRDIIASGCVPVVKLTDIFRQKGDSKIITNAEKIRTGNCELEYDNSSFILYGADDFKTSAKYMVALYRQKIEEFGKEDVCLLSPHHHAKTASSVDMLNKNVQYFINPEISGKPEVTYKDTVFRIGDIVMNTQNADGIANGDVGCVVGIVLKDGKQALVIDFSGIEKTFCGEELACLELGYAMSIHKSQGSEYKCVILNLLTQHSVMLKRNLLYTAVTRAKQQCVLVSNKAAIAKAILTEETNRRKTRLAEKIQYVFAKELDAVPFS